MTRLVLADAAGLRDLATYAARAKSVDPSGAIRLHAHGRALAAYVGVLPGRGLMGEGAVIGLRVAELGEPSEVDVTVSLAAVTDRLARGVEGRELVVPPVTVSAPWSAMAPPRSGWERVGAVDAQDLRAVARAGIEAVAVGAPEGSGARAVTALRQRVWGRLADTTPPVPTGAAFGAHVLGFIPSSGGLEVRTCGRWVRLSSAVGHVLTR